MERDGLLWIYPIYWQLRGYAPAEFACWQWECPVCHMVGTLTKWNVENEDWHSCKGPREVKKLPFPNKPVHRRKVGE